MNPAPAQEPAQEQRLVWSLWLAAVVVAVGGFLPLAFGGTSSRISSVILPYGVGAVALMAGGLLSRQNRTLVAGIYFVAGLAIVYGILSMFSLPVRLAALGSCPALPAPCTTGLPRILTDAENNGMGSATALGIVGLFVGFFGLVTIYRRQAAHTFTPPVRKIPPIEAPPAAPPPAPAPEPEPPAPPAKVKEPAVAVVDVDEEEPELPAPEELPELPAHESSPSTT